MEDYSRISSLKALDKAIKEASAKARAKEPQITRDISRVKAMTEPSNLFRWGLRAASPQQDNPLDLILLRWIRSMKERIRRL